MNGSVNVPGATAAELSAVQKQVDGLQQAQDGITGAAGSPVVVGADGKSMAAQPLAGTDYTANRVRGIALYQDEAPGSLPNGCLAGVYTIA